MKITEIVNEKSWTYTLVVKHIYLVGIAIAVLLYLSAWVISAVNIDIQSVFLRFLCGTKYTEFQKSNLPMNKQMESFIVVSNSFLVLGPILFFLILRKLKLNPRILCSEEKRETIKLLFGALFFFFLFVLCIFFMPYSDLIWGRILFHSNTVYILINSFMLAFTLFLEFFFYCFFYNLIFLQGRD